MVHKLWLMYDNHTLRMRPKLVSNPTTTQLPVKLQGLPSFTHHGFRLQAFSFIFNYNSFIVHSLGRFVFMHASNVFLINKIPSGCT